MLLVIRIAKEWLEKAQKSAKLVPEQRTIHRGASTYTATVWVDPTDKTAPTQHGFSFDERTKGKPKPASVGNKESHEESPGSRAASEAYDELMAEASSANVPIKRHKVAADNLDDLDDLDDFDPEEDLIRRTKEKYPGIKLEEKKETPKPAGRWTDLSLPAPKAGVPNKTIEDTLATIRDHSSGALAQYAGSSQYEDIDKFRDSAAQWAYENNKIGSAAKVFDEYARSRGLRKSILGPVASFVQEWIRKSRR